MFTVAGRLSLHLFCTSHWRRWALSLQRLPFSRVSFDVRPHICGRTRIFFSSCGFQWQLRIVLILFFSLCSVVCRCIFEFTVPRSDSQLDPCMPSMYPHRFHINWSVEVLDTHCSYYSPQGYVSCENFAEKAETKPQDSTAQLFWSGFSIYIVHWRNLLLIFMWSSQAWEINIFLLGLSSL